MNQTTAPATGSIPATSPPPIDPARLTENPVVGERATFLTNTADSGGAHLLLEIELAPGGGHTLHWHRKQTETFEVVRGQLGLQRGSERLVLEPGERASVPAGTVHRSFNPTAEPTVFRVDIRPALHFERAIHAINGLMRDGLMGADPKEFVRQHPFLAAIVAQDSDMRTPDVPLVVQDALFPLLAALGRWTGAGKVLARYQRHADGRGDALSRTVSDTSRAAGGSGSSTTWGWRREGAVSLHIAAPAEAVYARIADVTRTGERSEECWRVEWVPGSAPAPVVGARFRGHNRWGLARWSRVCEIVAAEPGHAFVFRTVPERRDPARMDSFVWGYALAPEGAGTRVTHFYRVAKLPLPPFRLLYGWVLPHHKDMRPAMRHTLEALKRSLEAPR